MLIGFQDDPEPSLARRPLPGLRPRPAGAREHRPDDRLLVAHRRDAPEERRQPVRPGVPVRRSGRVRPQRGPPRHGGHADDLGDPPVGERRQGPELRPDADEPTCRTSRGRWPSATRAGSTASRSSATSRSGTSRTSACSSRRSTTRRASPSPRRSTHASTAPRTRASRRGTGARSSASARPPRAAATTFSGRRERRRPSRPAGSPSCSPSSVRC